MSENVPIPRWIVIFAMVAIVLLGIGASISLVAPQRLVAPGAEINTAAQIYAGYTFSRNCGLFIVLCIGLLRRSRSILTVMMGLFSLVNFSDAIMDVKEMRLPVSAIALVLSVLAAMACSRLSKARSASPGL